MKRRTFLLGAAAVAVSGLALGARSATVRRRGDAGVLRVGVMTNLTHAPLLAGLGSGRIAKALAPVPIEAKVFRAGPRVCEALIGRAIDVGTAGSAAVVIHHSRHARALRIVGGCASGGASLVLAPGSRVRTPEDLSGKRLAVTGIGTTQDVALRTYLRQHGLRIATEGGTVTLIAVSSATILAQMKRGDLDGAWLAEPWATRMVREVGAERFLDERDLWPNRRFATAVLTTRADLASDPRIADLRRALDVEIERAVRDPETAREEAYRELARHVGNPGARAIFDAAWSFVDFTSDPVKESVFRFAKDARALGLCPPDAASGLLV